MPSRQPQQRSIGINVCVANEQDAHPVDEQQIVAAVEAILRDSDYAAAEISIAVVDDATMHQLNRQYLEHDYPTDVLSFVLDDDGSHLEGEVIISADTAATLAAQHDWPAAAEQLLYVIHGTLHLIGYRDKQPPEIEAMRGAEDKYLRQFGFVRRDAASEGATPQARGMR